MPKSNQFSDSLNVNTPESCVLVNGNFLIDLFSFHLFSSYVLILFPWLASSSANLFSHPTSPLHRSPQVLTSLYIFPLQLVIMLPFSSQPRKGSIGSSEVSIIPCLHLSSASFLDSYKLCEWNTRYKVFIYTIYCCPGKVCR